MFNTRTTRISAGLFSILLLVLTGIGCSDNSAGGGEYGTLTLGARKGAQQYAKLGAASSVTVTSAEVVIGRIRFKSVADSDSLDFRTDVPTIVDLQLDNSVQNLGSIDVPPGTYDETRFRIEKLDSAGGDLYTANPDLQDLTVRVAGYVDGIADSSFVWTADFMEDQVHEFLPVTIAAGDTVNLVFEFDIASWFVADGGGTLDPREALISGSVQSEIENNIKAAFKVARD